MKILALSFCVLIINIVTLSQDAAASNQKPCTPIEVIFAPGSGQPRGTQSEEFRVFSERIDQLARNATIPTNIYRLGTEHQPDENGVGYLYPAFGVGPDHIPRSIGAWADAGYSNSYGWSVEQGVKELNLYLKNRFQNGPCRDSRIILAGYSQGAQVVGQLLAMGTGWVHKSVLDRIDYVALFGDPKLYLPSGYGLKRFASACTTGIRDVWFEGSPNIPCTTSSGALNARKPYIPNEFLLKTGLWCNPKDFVCGSTDLAWETSGHGTYPSDGIEKGVRLSLLGVSKHFDECSKRRLLYALRHNQQAPTDCLAVDERGLAIPTRPIQQPKPAPCEFYALIDTAAAVSYQRIYHRLYIYTSNQSYSADVSAGLFHWYGCRVGVATYSSRIGNLVQPRVILNPTHDLNQIRSAIGGIRWQYYALASNNPQPPVDAQHSIASLHRLIQSIPRTEDSTIVEIFTHAILPRDEASNAPLLATARSRGIMFHGYQVFSCWITPVYDDQGEYNGLECMVPPILSRDTNTTTLNSPPASTPPELSSPVREMYATPGESVSLTVNPNDPIVLPADYSLYAWSVEGRDEVTFTETNHTSIVFEQPGTYQVSAYGIMDNRQTSPATITVHVSDSLPGSDLPNPPTGLVIRKISTDEIQVDWHANSAATQYLVRFNDGILGLTDHASLTVGKVNTRQAFTIHVSSVDADGRTGEPTTLSMLPDGSLTAENAYDDMANILSRYADGNETDDKPEPDAAAPIRQTEIATAQPLPARLATLPAQQTNPLHATEMTSSPAILGATDRQPLIPLGSYDSTSRDPIAKANHPLLPYAIGSISLISLLAASYYLLRIKK